MIRRGGRTMGLVVALVRVPTGANETADYPELDDDGAVVACYTVAPTGLTNDAVEDAQATFPGLEVAE